MSFVTQNEKDSTCTTPSLVTKKLYLEGGFSAVKCKYSGGLCIQRRKCQLLTSFLKIVSLLGTSIDVVAPESCHGAGK